MFEQLTETDPEAAEVKGRKSYFIISGVGLGTILFGAMVFSLFAVDFNIGMDEIEMVELLAPIDVTDQKLPELEAAPKQKPAGGPSKTAIRQINMASLSESPRDVPTAVSTIQNTSKARVSAERFEIGKFDSEQVGDGTSGRGSGTGSGDGTGLGDDTVAAVEDPAELPPPPVKKDAGIKEKPIVLSMGVVNSRAVNLPKPSVPATAKVGNATGTVSVQVLIDEKGKVVSANAVSGNILLRASSEAAARNAQFTPTLLSGTPIKISGVINYHFNLSSAE